MNEKHKKRKRLKTRKEMQDKILVFEEELKKIQDTITTKKVGGKLLPDQLNALYNYKIQFSTGIDMLKWALGEKDE